ncbi:Glycine cleavage system aminomethyltransferase GcvT [Aphelenchoides fujianensis]|nr:Glycine cleavage system aminomethyltransferase GcvT [Aphelenchoides fujianensis]
MVPFAGYSMPVQYKDGVLKEHLWTREHAGLFDVSHMGQARIRGDNPAKSFEKVVSADYQGLKPGKQRYGVLLNADGGIVDDLMTARPDDDGLFVVVNGACKDNDYAIIARELAGEATVTRLEDRALLALQGPEAAAVLAAHIPEAAQMVFMDAKALTAFGVDAIVSRSGYTGEDGYEISIPAAAAERVWNTLLADERAGLPLYGHDLDETISPIEAGLNFAVGKSRREAGDYLGAGRISKELAGALRPAREGAEIADAAGNVIGKVTSGGFAPSLGYPIAIGFAPPAHAAIGTKLKVIVRGKAAAAEVVASPFVPNRYVRKL